MNRRDNNSLTMSSILEKIVETKRKEIAAAKAERSEADLRDTLADAPPVRDFFAQLASAATIGLIAEVKKASPSAGVIREDFDPVAIAKTYADHGAHCISVLTDETYFQGNLDYLRQVREAVNVPLLRKDFILDSFQLLEARVAGADAILLIAECLEDCDLRKLHNETIELGMTPLVELYEPDNLPRVLAAGATLIGVNNRNLRTFEVDLNHTIRLRADIPSGCLVVGESGIKTSADVQRLSDAGVDAILVGESLMRAQDIGGAIDQLLGEY